MAGARRFISQGRHDKYDERMSRSLLPEGQLRATSRGRAIEQDQTDGRGFKYADRGMGMGQR